MQSSEKVYITIKHPCLSEIGLHFEQEEVFEHITFNWKYRIQDISDFRPIVQPDEQYITAS